MCVDGGDRRDVEDAENGVEGKLRGHVLVVEVVCGNTVFRGLREDVDAGDFKVANESEVHYVYELGDDERGLEELFLWDAGYVR